MPTHSHVGWGFLISLALHVTGIAALSLALPQLNVRPGVVRQVEFAVLEAPQETSHAAATAAPAPAPVPPPPAAELQPGERVPAPSDNPSATVEASAAVAAQAPPQKKAPTRKPTPSQPATASPRALASATHADPRSDGSALERVLKQIAATTELTQDERRKAMMTVLRTWEDPSGKRSAEELIDALLKDARKAREE